MIYIGGDKHGYKVIKIVEKWLLDNNHKFQNLGVKNENEDIKLESFLPQVALEVRKDENSLGIVTCGTGIGAEVGINKFSGIRACLADDPELARWSKVKDKCNVLCLIGWRAGEDKIRNILEEWFSAEYDGSESRLKMFKEFDTWN